MIINGQEFRKGVSYEETLALTKQALAEANVELTKAYTQSASAISGITAYDLEAPAKMLYPVLTPLRNKIPRVSANGGIQAAWRAVTGVNVNNISWGISEGNRAQVTVDSTQDYTAAYRGDGADTYVTWEAQYAGEGFQDVRALAALNLLKAAMIKEEKIILGGNSSLALGQVSGVVHTPNATGGAIPGGTTMYCQIVALTVEGIQASSVANGLPISGTVTLADGTTESRKMGTSQPSAQVTDSVTSGGDVGSWSISWTAIPGAAGYAVYWGTTTGHATLGAIIPNNSIKITTSSGGGQDAALIPNSDNSRNSLIYDGYLTQIFNVAASSPMSAYVSAQATGTPGTGTPLTGDGYGQITEFETLLKYMWDTWRLSPTEIWMNSQEARNISTKILAGQANTTQRFNFIVEQDKLTGGVIVKNYWNRYGLTDQSQSLPMHIHPFMPAGTIFFNCEMLPYPLSNVTNVTQIRLRRDYHQIEWPVRKRQWEIGVYWDGVLQNYAPFSLGCIYNIANG